ncbi:MAG TPA: IclR family transcriptional regulator [Ramlibacter sp.]|nr:IclR family transcriptional regulator [Ramlibacter sp.]
MHVLEALADAREALSLASLSALLELPKTSAMHLLRALEAGGYIRRTAAGFEVGPASVRLAAKIGPGKDLEGSVREVLQDLQEATQETILLGTFTEDRRSAIYTMRLPSPLAVRFAPEVGGQRPLYASGIGKLLLAYAQPGFVEDYLRQTRLERITPKTVSTRAALSKQLKQARSSGLALSVDEMADGGSALAAPVFDRKGDVVFAVVIAAPTGRLLQRRAQFEDVLKQAARRLSALHGGTVVPGLAA